MAVTHTRYRLPPDLFKLYIQYKHDTRAVVKWLAHHGDGKITHTEKFAIHGLFQLAACVLFKGIELPSIIAFHFREAIAARRRISKSFQKANAEDVVDQDTCDHEHFTARRVLLLRELYEMLCAKPIEPDNSKHDHDSRVDSRMGSPNPFVALEPADSDTSALDLAGGESYEGCCSEHTTHETVKPTKTEHALDSIVDDHLGDAIEICQILQDADDLLQATKIAWEQAARAVLEDSTMPCRCSDTLALRLECVQTEMEAFVHAKCFDLYFQSPWVCGGHILTMVEALFYYGLRLFSYRNYVGSVLHMYNLLRELSSLEEIPILEHICQAFEQTFFPGGRPNCHFRACYTRYRGGRLHFDSHSSTHKNGCHSVRVPVHTARATSGMGKRAEMKDCRLDYRRVSMLMEIKHKDYRLDTATWDRLLSGNGAHQEQSPKSPKRTGICSHHRQPSQGSCLPDYGTRLLSLGEAVKADFEGPMPVAKLNLFKIYLACVRVTEVISNGTHDEPERNGQYCLCYLDALLLAADRCTASGRVLRPLGHRDLATSCKKVIRDEFGNAKLEDFLWQGL
ncbi:hypothetical protein LTR56_017849 [Elasticomyces elasticus]|nr:hypothetical protein LTR56_017849 [Elasticomyces elasticus]